MRILTVKPENVWKLHDKQTDLISFYNAKTQWKEGSYKSCEIDIHILKGTFDRLYGTIPYELKLTSRYPVLLCDGQSKTTITASLMDKEGLIVKSDGIKITFEIAGTGIFDNNQSKTEICCKRHCQCGSLFSQNPWNSESNCKKQSPEKQLYKYRYGYRHF